MKSSEEIDAGTLSRLLSDYFPAMIFFNIEKKTDDLSIKKYFVKKQGIWTVDIAAMSKSDDKNYACLFPKEISQWDEAQARNKYGSADVIRFFIYEQNEAFFSKISCLKNQSINFDKKSVADSFLADIDYYEGRPVWESWDLSGVVKHKMRHDPPSIYEAFDYYARRRYNLLAFALNDASYDDNNPLNSDADYLLKRGNEIVDKAVEERYPEVKKLKIEKQTRIFELQQEVLENVPNKGTGVPRELEDFIEQLKGGINGIKKNKYDDSDLPYNKSDIRTINNLLNLLPKIKPDINEDELEKMQSGTLYEKVDLLYNNIKIFSQPERTSIEALFLKKRTLSLYEKSNKNEDGDKKPSSFYDVTTDEKSPDPQDSFIRRLPFFEDEFKQELSEKKLKIFLEGLFDYYDPDKNLIIDKYKKRKLFEFFCSVADIPTDEALWKPFLVKLNRAIDNINLSKKD